MIVGTDKSETCQAGQQERIDTAVESEGHLGADTPLPQGTSVFALTSFT